MNEVHEFQQVPGYDRKRCLKCGYEITGIRLAALKAHHTLTKQEIFCR